MNYRIFIAIMSLVFSSLSYSMEPKALAVPKKAKKASCGDCLLVGGQLVVVGAAWLAWKTVEGGTYVTAMSAYAIQDALNNSRSTQRKD